MAKNKIIHSVRYLANEILEAIESEGAYSNILLNKMIDQHKLSEKDAGLLTELVYGVTQRKLTLDYGLTPYVRSPKKLESWVRNLLRLSAYQMVYLDKIPDHAILYDAVEIAKFKGHTGISKLVNGILRNVQRNGLKDWKEITDPIERMSIGSSVPVWIIKKLINQLGNEKAESLAHSLQIAPYLSIRIQDRTVSIDEVRQRLLEDHIKAEASPISPYGLRVHSGRVVKSELFKNGIITIQDESSQLVALFGSLKPTDKVLDACAAPGGKTVHIASFLDKAVEGEVHALDIHEHKIKLIEENTKRLHVTDEVITHLLDAKKSSERFDPKSFDVIFVDAPCSGMGLMRRKPEIKYSLKDTDIHELQKQQQEILNAVEPLLKTDGRLIYSTCTIVQEENQETVQTFLKEHPNMKVIPADSKSAFSPEIELPSTVITPEGYVEIYPDDFGTDGFFICAMEKTTRGEE
ncbi:16S rRNA (cytosine(967)-C(5))-methyltransferase RsmB [Jeotgalibaca sp. MA1X17-3]|uniref:16S rRNA (cytosine(967)-C(5))-methyltransferase RsmB n=1 Tax=Jeotgalibaca sp. MA1X17-3 TaxID=2908211 RepID=UPI001F2679E1|nr:16S rRNA (cytosine(967)-C(5))-methyltransferase RsmB [Jeotgalibaca sp. MA1X17-3]UJF14943.1 16S rRNA (cytosine(967)-C(5))-methyltransferase RsmB [Jeotgalibaca sp. MA1X17-3]